MRLHISLILFLTASLVCQSQESKIPVLTPGYEQRIRDYVDTLKVIDTHEHLLNPTLLKLTTFLDFSLLLQQNSYDGLITSGMPVTSLRKLYFEPTPVSEKWKIIEPYWNKSFNTISNRIMLLAVKDLYGIDELSASTVEALSAKIKKAYSGEWYNYVLHDLCNIRYVILDGDNVGAKYDYVKYAKRFSTWLSLNTKFRIDSIAVMQVEPIYTLEDYVKSMSVAFEDGLKKGMAAVKVNIAYKRSLSFEKVPVETARKVFRTLINGNEDLVLPAKEAKQLQDYMMFQLLELTKKYKVPVAFHTGIQAGGNNFIGNSDPALLTNLFYEFPDVNFVLFHGSYPFGGELTTLVRNFSNVFIDMNWTYSISPAYSARYLDEWLDAVPASKIMAFGGDQRCVENTYGNLVIARQVISKVLTEKVKSGYWSEKEVFTIARMILYDNAAKFYNLP
ncbi:MAG: amidohydrolase family protein [Bacteroidia bacterium]|nr:amidohydrolase family protein [Bacteroidia bacterium]